MAILGFLTIPWLGPKDTEPRAPSVPKVKLGHTEPRAPSVPKEKLGHSNPMCNWVLLFRKLSIWVGCNYPPRLGPKDTELNVPSAPNGKLGHTDHAYDLSQRQS